MKTKLIFSNYNPETGLSAVQIANKYGEFYGLSHLSEEDKKYESSFAGCQYAEIKANIACVKYQIKIAKIELKTLETCYFDISQMKGFNVKSIEAIAIRKKIERQKQKIIKLTNKKDRLTKNFFSTIKKREEYVDRMVAIKKREEHIVNRMNKQKKE